MLFLNQNGKEHTLGNKVNTQKSRTRVLDLLKLYSHARTYTHIVLCINWAAETHLHTFPNGLAFESSKGLTPEPVLDHKPRGPEDNFIARSLALLVTLCCLSDLCLYS